jgi:hypothetical protein
MLSKSILLAVFFANFIISLASSTYLYFELVWGSFKWSKLGLNWDAYEEL